MSWQQGKFVPAQFVGKGAFQRRERAHYALLNGSWAKPPRQKPGSGGFQQIPQPGNAGFVQVPQPQPGGLGAMPQPGRPTMGGPGAGRMPMGPGGAPMNPAAMRGMLGNLGQPTPLLPWQGAHASVMPTPGSRPMDGPTGQGGVQPPYPFPGMIDPNQGGDYAPFVPPPPQLPPAMHQAAPVNLAQMRQQMAQLHLAQLLARLGKHLASHTNAARRPR